MRILQLLGAVLLLFASPALASDGSAIWMVAQKSGDVRVIRNGLQPASVQVRAALSPGDVVSTGANGRAMLTRGEDYVVVAPSSRLLLPKEEQRTGVTRLIQQVGTMLYKVRHTGVPHFAVETPMLAAVVKGTSFTVIVDKDRAAVQVTEGLVEVSSVVGNARRLVEGGLTVYVDRKRPSEIIEVKPGAIEPQGAGSDAVKIERSGDVPLSAITDLTGGLIREAAVAPVVAITNTPILSGLVSTPINGSSAPVVGVEPSAPTATNPVVDLVEGTVPSVTDPVIDIIDTTVPIVIEPVIDIVDTTVPIVIEPVIDIVDTTVPTVIEPVIDIVETTLPTVTEPITAPVVDVVGAVVPAVVEPIVTTVPPILGSPLPGL